MIPHIQKFFVISQRGKNFNCRGNGLPAGGGAGKGGLLLSAATVMLVCGRQQKWAETTLEGQTPLRLGTPTRQWNQGHTSQGHTSQPRSRGTHHPAAQRGTPEDRDGTH